LVCTLGINVGELFGSDVGSEIVSDDGSDVGRYLGSRLGSRLGSLGDLVSSDICSVLGFDVGTCSNL
jgi:hypothetical protein